MAALFEFLPLVAFFAAFWWNGIFFATGVLLVLTVAQVGWLWVRGRPIPKLMLAAAALALLFGGATLLLHDERFIKWKASVVYWLFAAAFAGSALFTARPLWQRALDELFEAPRRIWLLGNGLWAAYFLALGFVNIWVFTRYDTATWVTFKVWGAMGASLVMLVLQGLLLARFGRPRQEA
jgi:intracellular septation protein